MDIVNLLELEGGSDLGIDLDDASVWATAAARGAGGVSFKIKMLDEIVVRIKNRF